VTADHCDITSPYTYELHVCRKAEKTVCRAQVVPGLAPQRDINISDVTTLTIEF